MYKVFIGIVRPSFLKAAVVFTSAGVILAAASAIEAPGREEERSAIRLSNKALAASAVCGFIGLRTSKGRTRAVISGSLTAMSLLAIGGNLEALAGDLAAVGTAS